MKYYYFDEESEMVLINNFQSWKKENHGEGDALWRNGIAYITSKEEKVKKGILRTFRKKENGKYQSCRCNPCIGEDTVSRDQVLLAWISLYLNGDFTELKDLVENTPFRLSKKFLMTPTMWLWSRGLIGKKFYGKIAQLFLTIELFFGVYLNKLIKKLIGWKEYSQDELEEMLKERGEDIRYECLNTKFKQFLWKIKFPGYGLHLAAWTNYTGSDFMKKTNNKLIQKDMDSKNLLLKLLTNIEITEDEIKEYKPQEEWRWSQQMNKCCRSRLLPEVHGNEYDVNILYTLKDRK